MLKQPQPALKHLSISVTIGKDRSNAPIWNFFDVSDKKIKGRIEKGAVCKVDISGVPCGKRIMQNGTLTAGLNPTNNPKQCADQFATAFHNKVERLRSQ